VDGTRTVCLTDEGNTRGEDELLGRGARGVDGRGRFLSASFGIHASILDSVEWMASEGCCSST